VYSTIVDRDGDGALVMDGQTALKSGRTRTKIPERGRPLARGQEDTDITPPPAPVRLRSQLAPAELEALRPVIHQLYIEEGQTFRQVQKQLRAWYNYNPT